MTAHLGVGADSIVYTEQTQIPGMGVQQNTIVRFNPADLSVTQVDQTGTQGGQAAETHLTYAAGRVKGRSVTPQQSGTPTTTDLDTTVVAGTYDDNALSTIATALPLTAGQTFNLTVFESGKNRSSIMQIKVSDGGAVTVPAGTFQTLRLEISGGQVPIVLSVAKDTPRRIVKIEVVGAPLMFELVK
jgi:hypothetical protein